MQSNLSRTFKLLCYSTQLRFSRWSAHFFIYMLNNYFRIKSLEKTFKLHALPSDLIQTIPKLSNIDVNNVIIVNQKYLKTCNINTKFVKLYQNKTLKRICFVIGIENLEEDEVYLSDTLVFNLKNTTEVQLRQAYLSFAPDIDLSLVNSCIEIKHETIEKLLKNYFEFPKLVRVNDVITINIRQYHPEFFFTSTKLGLTDVHFKCNQVLVNGDHISENTVLCVYGETTLKLSPNVQTYLAPVSHKAFEFSNSGGKFENDLIDSCPYGLESYVDSLKKAISPFLNSNSLKLKPCFLLQGKKGSGKYEIVTSLASKLGVHLYETTSREITSSTYAQSEIKLRNIFSKAKLCSPCILIINNFENFGKNNEGQYDERILNFFKTEVNNLFIDNKFPVILVCVSNSKDIPNLILRTFLEIFEINVPDNSQRVRMLEWILKTQQLPYDANLEDIGNKSRGFLFEDLKALVYHARQKKKDTELQDDDFNYAVDLMQSNYSQNMGAPKIPKVQWSDIGGLSNVKQEITKTVDLHMKNPEFFVQSGLKSSGILLYGPPGTGKTLLAKAVATECNLCFLSVKGPELLNMYVGQSEKNIREVFDKAREASPCIIFFDELDSLAPNRGASGDSGGVMDRVVSQLLAEMDGLSQQASIFIIAATNRPDLIDQALLRPGRFDKLLYVGPCTDPESKLSVLKALTRKFNLAKNVNLNDVIDFCPKNLTGADFYGLAYNAWKSAVRKLIENLDKSEMNHLTHASVLVTLDDFKRSLADLKPSITEQDLAYFKKLQQQFNVKNKKKTTKDI